MLSCYPLKGILFLIKQKKWQKNLIEFGVYILVSGCKLYHGTKNVLWLELMTFYEDQYRNCAITPKR
jgi:hypothetical protein